MLNAPVYLVVPTRALSGAEKRFVGMWLHLQKQGVSDVQLVTSAELVESACKNDELKDVARFRSRIVTTNGSRKMRFELAPTLARLWLKDRRSVFHFVMLPPGPLEIECLRRSLFTIPDPYLEHYSPAGLAQLYMGTSLARRVDMLDPVLFERFRDRFFFKRDAFSLTPNSFVDTDAFTPAPASEKTNTLTFVGRFVDEKQAHRLVDALPEVDRRLREAGIANPAWRILGNGDDALAERGEELAKTMDVFIGFEPNPQRVLRTSKVFFSLQRANNYPSKSLLEAMACGNVPVVTDVGTTEKIAPRDLAEYVPRDFTRADLARACLAALQMPDAAFEERVSKMRAFLDERFPVRTMAAYYLGIYGHLAKESR